MLIGNNETTKLIDRYAIDNLKIPSIVLMENAAIDFVNEIDEKLDNFLIVCGKGNNGGDGYAIARQLWSKGKKVKIFGVSFENLSCDCKINYDICKNIEIGMSDNIEKLKTWILQSDCIIEGIFGTGLNSEVKGVYKKIIEIVNEYSNQKEVYSIDIPSGISGDNGEIMGTCIKADKTISFVTYKKAFLNTKNSKYFGKIVIKNIGLNQKFFKNLINEYYLTKLDIKNLHKARNVNSHKGDFGKVLIYAGSKEFSGASVLASNSCVRAGAGLVTLLTSENILKNNILSEVMHLNINSSRTISENDFKNELQKIENNILNSDVIAIGPGIGKTEKSLTILEKLLNYEKNNKNKTINLVLDADALNLISENPKLFEKIENRAVLTPHIVEFSRISGLSPEDILSDKFTKGKEFAKKYKVILLLKGKNTIITDGNKLFVNSTGNSHMANGGMGDCLTGIITSLVAQNYNLIESACIGAFLHGYIGDELTKKQYIVNASHVTENISKYMKEIFEM